MSDAVSAATNSAVPSPSCVRKGLLISEWLLLYGVAPTLVALRWLPGIALKIGLPMLVVAMLTFLVWDKSFDNRQLGKISVLRAGWRAVLIRFLLGASALGLMVLVFEPHRLFAFPLQAPRIWAVVMVLYPVVSVYPQEIVYRAYYFHRYAGLFPGRQAMVFSNALAFSFAHLLFWNPIAIILTFIGGLFFAHTYAKTRSMIAVCVEHALYGCFIFTIGLGEYFYHGAV